MKRHLAIYVEEHEFARLKEEAGRRRISLSRYLHDRLLESEDAMQFEHRPVRAIANLADESGTTRAALAEELKAPSRQVGILTGMLDQFARATTRNTPGI